MSCLKTFKLNLKFSLLIFFFSLTIETVAVGDGVTPQASPEDVIKSTTDLPTSLPALQSEALPSENLSTTSFSSSLLSTDVSSTDMPNFDFCPSGVACEDLSIECFECDLNASCIYGRNYNVTCRLLAGLDCVGKTELVKPFKCRYCFQTEDWEQICTPANNCVVHSCPRERVTVNCSAQHDVVCLGSRRFHKNKDCNWTSGYKWSTAFILSVTLGGFGVDRFYLGYWESGLGKLFSFGGIGIWTLIDILLIGIGYIPPEDGSLYV